MANASESREVGPSTCTAMVLCGGLGTRLAGVLTDRPKALAPVGDEPFLFLLLDQLAAAGITRVVLCTGHLGDQIEAVCGPEHAGMALVYSREAAPLGTGGALRKALVHIDDEAVLVCNGDTFVEADLRAFATAAAAAGRPAAMLVANVPDTARFGALTVAPDGAVAAFGEKGRRGPGAINAGVYLLARTVLATIPDGRPCSLEREVLPRLVGTGLTAIACHGGFLDIGVPADLARAPAFFAEVAARRQRPQKRLLIVDRDGTLIEERHYLADPAGVRLLPGVASGLRALCADGFDVAIVTNQSGIGRGMFDHATADAVNAEVVEQLAREGVAVRGVYMCPHHPDDRCACRKPQPALVEHALADLGYAPADCLVVGDKKCDVDLGARIGARTALVRTGYGRATEIDGMCAPDLVVDGLADLARLEVAR